MMVERALPTNGESTAHDEYTTRIFGTMLRIADGYRVNNNLRQALEMYFDMLSKFADLPESRKLRERIMEIAELYESKGEMRQARAICERLL